MPDQRAEKTVTEVTARQPKCPKCGSKSLTLMEEHRGYGCWSSAEWQLDGCGEVLRDLDADTGWSVSTPTGRFLLECEDCEHQWTMRKRKATL